MQFAEFDELRPAETGWRRGARGFWLAKIGADENPEAFLAAGIEALARTGAFLATEIGAEICTGRFPERLMGGEMAVFLSVLINFLACPRGDCLIRNMTFCP